ncbi:LLM class flavin-dependent oxidoreductase [Nonomuraea polychroma]|uniref:LLM class flavin-dependent oxidoreductase n=1 Tax=Nonomuraea polychroma TaxID=46176 RepID=UPI0019D4A549|nr:LLM class flavin-dependent oxidoreductase [Nonomuraea polychroma]
MFAEKLRLLLAIRENPEHVTWRGRFRPAMDGLSVQPSPQQLPLWLGVGGTPSSVERAGCLGLPMALGLIGGDIRTGPPPRRALPPHPAAPRRSRRADVFIRGMWALGDASAYATILESEGGSLANVVHWRIATVEGQSFDEGVAAFQQVWNPADHHGPRRRRVGPWVPG